MKFLANGLPNLSSVPMGDIQQTIFAYQHFTDVTYPFPQAPVRPEDRSKVYVMDKVYDR